MRIEFDAGKDAANVEKHGISLFRAIDLNPQVLIPSGRDAYGGERMRAYGMIDGRFHLLVFTMRDGVLRAISLRRVKRREFRRYVPD